MSDIQTLPFERSYAIGDIHGRADLMDRLLALIAQDAGATPHNLIFLGDYIDRGPDSKGVIDRLIALSKEHPSVIVIRGNHEDYMQIALTNKNYNYFNLTYWGALGGDATLESYGIDWRRDDVPAMMADFRTAAGQEHIDFIRGMRPCFQTATHIFHHTGEGTLYEAKETGRTLVQGHIETKTHLPVIESNRIMVDTAAYRSNRLTACVIEPGAAPRFVMTF